MKKRVPTLIKSEIKIIKSDDLTDDEKDFSDQVNDLLEQDWAIQSSACAACVFFDNNIVIQRHTYTVILYKETYE